MFGKYEDLVLVALLSGLLVSIILIIILLTSVIDLKKDNNRLKEKNRRMEAKVDFLRITASRIFLVIDSNASAIVLLRKQMNQVHRWLGEVLSISGLICDDDGAVNSGVLIEELRDQVKWEHEREQRQVDENDYYKLHIR